MNDREQEISKIIFKLQKTFHESHENHLDRIIEFLAEIKVDVLELQSKLTISKNPNDNS